MHGDEAARCAACFIEGVVGVEKLAKDEARPRKLDALAGLAEAYFWPVRSAHT
jgi:hypothetical protein